MRNSLILLFLCFMDCAIYGQKSIVKIYKYDNGLIKESITYTTEYKDHDNSLIKNGPFTSYYPTSKSNFIILWKNQELLKKETGSYKYGLKDGYWIEYYRPLIINNKVTPGLIKSEGNYLGCNKIGIWKYYDDKGTISQKEHKIKLKYPPDFYPCRFVFQKSEKLNVIVKYTITDDCSIDNIEFITNKGKGHDEFALFRSIKLQSLKEFWTYKVDTTSTGEITNERVILWDKNTCISKAITDTIKTDVNIAK